MPTDHQKAIALQAELRQLTQKLAAEIAKLPSNRDPVEIDALWRRVGTYRSPLSALYRSLRKLPQLPRSELSRGDYEAQRAVRQDMKLLDQRLKKWSWMETLIARHRNPVRSAFSLDVVPTENAEMLDLFHDALFSMANPNAQSGDAMDRGLFADIPMKIRPFDLLMRVAYRLLLIQGRTENARFLDVGCGGGTKLLAANLYFPKCDGLEYDRDYVAAAQRMIQVTDSEHCQAFEADGLTFDGYGDYDVIYFYRPLRDDTQLAKMEEQIFSNAKPGTVILAPYNGFLAKRPGNDRPRVMDCVFLAGMTQSEINTWRTEAEYTGTDEIIRSKAMNFDAGFWKPLLDVSTFNGGEPV